MSFAALPLAAAFPTPRTLMDDSTNPLTSPSPDSDPAQPQSLSLTPDQLAPLGLQDCEPGETYTIQVQAGEDGADGSKTFDVLSSTPDDSAETGLDDAAPADEEADTPAPDDGGSDESSLLGYSRKKKSPREGLPDTKKMREVI